MFAAALYPEDLIYLAAADSLGQLPQGNTDSNMAFLFERLDIFKSVMSAPFFSLDDLRQAGITDENILDETMNFARKLRLAGISSNSAFKQALSYARKLEKSLH